MKRMTAFVLLALFGIAGTAQAQDSRTTDRIPPVSVSAGRTFQVIDFAQLDSSRQQQVLSAYRIATDPKSRAAQCTSLIGPTWWSVNCISGNCHCYIYGDVDGTAPPSTSCGCN